MDYKKLDGVSKFSLIFAVVIFCSIFSGFAGAAEIAGLGLQPGALGFAGTYALRSYEPQLTGRGVTFALICRSLTYEDNEPQNDYQLNIAHSCFADSNVSFAGTVSLDAGISEHATAIGAILTGSDPNA